MPMGGGICECKQVQQQNTKTTSGTAARILGRQISVVRLAFGASL